MNDYRCPICRREHVEGGYLVEIGGLLKGDIVVCENENYMHLIRKGTHIVAKVLQFEKLKMNLIPN